MNLFIKLFLVGLVLLTVGCAATTRILRPEPTQHCWKPASRGEIPGQAVNGHLADASTWLNLAEKASGQKQRGYLNSAKEAILSLIKMLARYREGPLVLESQEYVAVRDRYRQLEKSLAEKQPPANVVVVPTKPAEPKALLKARAHLENFKTALCQAEKARTKETLDAATDLLGQFIQLGNTSEDPWAPKSIPFERDFKEAFKGLKSRYDALKVPTKVAPKVVEKTVTAELEPVLASITGGLEEESLTTTAEDKLKAVQRELAEQKKKNAYQKQDLAQQRDDNEALWERIKLLQEYLPYESYWPPFANFCWGLGLAVCAIAACFLLWRVGLLVCWSP